MLWRPGLDPAHEPSRIRIVRGAWVDDRRDGRTIPYKIYYPDEGDGTGPLIVWSHGLGGSRDGGGFIHRFLAAHGYVVACIQHPGTDSSLWEGKAGHPWDVIRATHIPRHATLDRYRDVPFALDRLFDLDRDHPDIAARVDLARIGMSGHSFGANTTQIMAGQKLGYGVRQYSLREPRFSCGILYSPVPSYNRKDPPARIYGAIDIPLFHMTGTIDTSPVEGFPYTRRLEVFDASGGPDQYLLVLNGGDHMVYNGSRGKLEENPRVPRHEAIIKAGALAFWDSYLKGDALARDWLSGDGFRTFLADAGTCVYRP